MNSNDIQTLANNLWEYMKPKVAEMLSSNVCFYRAQVVAAAQNNKITIQRPFDQAQLSLPYVSAMANASVGSQVTVFVFGRNANNANNSVIVGNGTFTQ